LTARLDASEDPEDVYRAWIPAKSRLTVALQPSANVNLALWRATTKSVFETGRAQRRDLLGASVRLGKARDTASIRNGGRTGMYVYVDAFLAKNVRSASYALAITTARP
jgi:hypothetical protein